MRREVEGAFYEALGKHSSASSDPSTSGWQIGSLFQFVTKPALRSGCFSFDFGSSPDELQMNDTLFLGLTAVLLPTLFAAGLAWPFWSRRRIIAGNVAGSVLILLAITVLIWYRYGTMIEAQSQCASDCATDMQTLYTPFLMLVVLGWVDVFILLILSGIAEDRLKRKRRMNKEWL